MTPYHADPWLTVYQGDCRKAMASMEPASVHCVVTSPPYWGLRDYGTATWVGGHDGCDHLRAPVRAPGERLASTLGGTPDTMRANEIATRSYQATCGKCGAIREDSQLGLEPTPEEYVANMVDVFREVRRVLRDDGTVWLNLGDSYATSNPVGRRDNGREVDGRRVGTVEEQAGSYDVNVRRAARRWGSWDALLKPKDLVGIPWRVAFALQADGWYLRSDIIWAKPNPMPESVTDRPTKAHEYVFLLSKSARYWFDAEAVREDALNAGRIVTLGAKSLSIASEQQPDRAGSSGHRVGDSITVEAGRNIRSVWTVATQPYPGAHFATFPEKLVEPCIKAGCPDRVCSECGRGLERETEVDYTVAGLNNARLKRKAGGELDGFTARPYETRKLKNVTTLGWRAPCGHDAPTQPGVVLDPFAGSGTTGRVAQRLSRRAVLIDLNAEYLVQAMSRNAEIPLGLESA